MRVTLLALLGLLTLLATHDSRQLLWVGLLLAAWPAAYFNQRVPIVATLGRCAEVIIVCLGATSRFLGNIRVDVAATA